MGRIFFDLRGLELEKTETQLLTHPNCAGIILFSRNYKNSAQLIKLVDSIRVNAHPDILVIVDHEGGQVQRFVKDFTPIPPMYELGQLYDQNPKLAINKTNQLGKTVAQELLYHGIDFSLGPVLDLHHHQSTIIGQKKRSFHEKETSLVSLASAWIRGLNEEGMVAIGKHFPGHGHVFADSHLHTISDKRSLDQLQNELSPFRRLKLQLGGIMPAHLIFPKICNNIVSQSKEWLDTILRQEIGFEGLVISDCLSMVGSGTAPLLEKLLSTLAVCDVAIVSHIEGYNQSLWPTQKRVDHYLNLLDRVPGASRDMTRRLALTQGQLKGIFKATTPA